jgi:hypothetical protein
MSAVEVPVQSRAVRRFVGDFLTDQSTEALGAEGRPIERAIEPCC